MEAAERASRWLCIEEPSEAQGRWDTSRGLITSGRVTWGRAGETHTSLTHTTEDVSSSVDPDTVHLRMYLEHTNIFSLLQGVFFLYIWRYQMKKSILSFNIIWYCFDQPLSKKIRYTVAALVSLVYRSLYCIILQSTKVSLANCKVLMLKHRVMLVLILILVLYFLLYLYLYLYLCLYLHVHLYSCLPTPIFIFLLYQFFRWTSRWQNICVCVINASRFR